MKKNCNIIKDLLPLYLDNVCSSDTLELVEEHLQTCKECSGYLEGLKFNIKHNKNEEINIFKKFAKKINFKIIRNAIIIVGIIIILSIPCLRFYGTHEFTMEYDEKMKISLLGNEKKWNFQFDTPISGYNYTQVRTFNENGKIAHYIFITHKYTPQNYIEAKKGFVAGSAPEIDYDIISLNDRIFVYYTTENLDKIKNASKNEINMIIENSTLIFNNDKEITNINCTLNNQNYKYSLTYYETNKQIIESNGDELMPNELLMEISSINGDYKSLWFPGDTSNEIFEKIEEYISNQDGTCTLINQ